jgi:hypothetical protein
MFRVANVCDNAFHFTYKGSARPGATLKFIVTVHLLFDSQIYAVDSSETRAGAATKLLMYLRLDNTAARFLLSVISGRTSYTFIACPSLYAGFYQRYAYVPPPTCIQKNTSCFCAPADNVHRVFNITINNKLSLFARIKRRWINGGGFKKLRGPGSTALSAFRGGFLLPVMIQINECVQSAR